VTKNPKKWVRVPILQFSIFLQIIQIQKCFQNMKIKILYMIPSQTQNISFPFLSIIKVTLKLKDPQYITTNEHFFTNFSIHVTDYISTSSSHIFSSFLIHINAKIIKKVHILTEYPTKFTEEKFSFNFNFLLTETSFQR
jgi:hypothetical protein